LKVTKKLRKPVTFGELNKGDNFIYGGRNDKDGHLYVKCGAEDSSDEFGVNLNRFVVENFNHDEKVIPVIGEIEISYEV
jgi:hypothetical protein